MNQALRRVSLACLVLFLLLLVNDNYVQAFEAGKLVNDPGNGRTFAQQYQYQRGSIITADNKTIAESRHVGGIYSYQRYYPDPVPYAPVTGYTTPYSATGIEAAENKLLAGTDPRLTVRNLIDLITGKPKKGATVQLTINSVVQQAAYDAIKATGLPSAAVAIDPATGAILALASYPTFNPNKYATFNGAQLNKADERYRNSNQQPLLNRAINDTFPPGSTFKIVTSSTFFNNNASNSPQTMVESPTQLTLPQTNHVLTNDLGEVCGNGSGQTTLIQAFLQSCDTTFGKIGINVGANALNNQAQQFGMNSSALKIPMPVTPSNYVLPPSEALTAYSAIGQFSDTATAMQEAMFSAAIANGGKLMKPYLVQGIVASDLSTVQDTAPSVLNQAVSPAVANNVGQMMEAVVQQQGGTANAFNQGAIGVNIAGKTGTAENGPNNANLNDAVFTAFGPYGSGNPKIAVGVIIQGGGYGATAAAPIAVQVIKAYLGIR
jgi:peptidoglycan glycosyltransferase